MAVVSTTSQWMLHTKAGLDGLTFQENVPVGDLTETSCLIKIEAVTLNHRDVALPTGRWPMVSKESVIPCSDAAGTVIAIGSQVTLHRVGDKICSLFYRNHQSGFPTSNIRQTTPGSVKDGVLRQYAVFDEAALVPAPKSLTFAESATLPCAAVTAWNALTGVSGRTVQANDIVLVQGTGGVSLFAAQFALAVGATVIATTSSEDKAQRLKAIGVQHVINYKNDENWGQTAKSLTPDGEGAHHIIEVGGEMTMAQSLQAIRPEGVITLIGLLGGISGERICSFGDVLKTMSIVRGVNVGSKAQFTEMNDFIDRHQVKPFIDEHIFGFSEAREAYQYMLDAKHWGKIVIDIGGSSKQ